MTEDDYFNFLSIISASIEIRAVKRVHRQCTDIG